MSAANVQPILNIQSFREGDHQEFRNVFNLFYDRMFLFAQNLIKKQAEAKDIATESFIKLWKLHQNFETQENIKAFLYVTTRNACLDHFRSLQLERMAQKELRHSPDSDKGIENAILDAEIFTELVLQIEDLPSRCKAVSKAIYFENLGTAEIAAKLGMTPQNVLNQKARAVQKLRSGLIKKGF